MLIHWEEARPHALLTEEPGLRGRGVRVGAITGTGAGIGPDGSLLIDTATGRQELFAGEVEIAW